MNANKIYKRQIDLIRPTELSFPVTIIGAGGIGSWTAFLLAKMGVYNMTVIDFDKVEEHNIPSQVYGLEDVGTHKVSALQVILTQFTHVPLIPFTGTVEEFASEGMGFGQVVICAVDSLAERRKIWEIVKLLLGGIDLYIDARMGGEQFRILCVSPFQAESIVKYQKSMDAVTKADPTPCTARSIIYNTSTIGSFITSIVKKYARKEVIEVEYMFDTTNFEQL